jgi:hypothetical protein
MSWVVSPGGTTSFRSEVGRDPAVVAGQCVSRWHLGGRVEGAKMSGEDSPYHQPARPPQRVGAVGVSIPGNPSLCGDAVKVVLFAVPSAAGIGDRSAILNCDANPLTPAVERL